MPKRIYASLFHLLISFLLVVSVVAFVIFLWYPGYYFSALGVQNILFVLAAVDITIGPLITLIIFNPLKKSLKMDLAIIAVLQLAALLFGIHTIFSGRPVYLVYNIDMFTIVTAADIPDAELDKAMKKTLPMAGPLIVGARLPEDSAGRKTVLFSALNGGPDLPQMPQFYLGYQEVAADVKARLLTMDSLNSRIAKAKRADGAKTISDALGKADLKMHEVGFVPVRGKVQDLTMMVRLSDASIVELLPIDPWGQ
ncbi:TfpX/TfpZ family type IV pilin accessory protein [Actimicrobium sp. CCC2.4]|uniref:TfpX/TfpZ family type IV pilin accessory protein n=1 Tax=Actimicrobium sp. CCC2.4 TaxID=3048606 RepID=UPI002AC89E76|nr:TfpX/TfpZ family type IV pilin accessory protein [Actimicrobium sp. CCC2.4]MEB0136103.1 TfpX/TfpZ family type IV pilin accessory protein [Actimicrobium sp. CCC2.4]WPX32139.1 TfpX/TfpZ family type IV pilin accessory protein [Actimicrobium sp. CCC2.4]